jgi:hypothetical protein
MRLCNIWQHVANRWETLAGKGRTLISHTDAPYRLSLAIDHLNCHVGLIDEDVFARWGGQEHVRIISNGEAQQFADKFKREENRRADERNSPK